MKSIIKIVSLSFVLLLAACSTMQPPRYSISVDNIQTLKKFKGVKAEVVSLNQSATFSANCRLMGPIEPADGLTISAFVAKALNDELKLAELHSVDGVKLSGDVTKVEFSSITGLTNGFWDLGLTLNSSNGKSLSVTNKHTFKSGFDGITACNATADALPPAVQDLLSVVVNHPSFRGLLE